MAKSLLLVSSTYLDLSIERNRLLSLLSSGPVVGSVATLALILRYSLLAAAILRLSDNLLLFSAVPTSNNTANTAKMAAALKATTALRMLLNVLLDAPKMRDWQN